MQSLREVEVSEVKAVCDYIPEILFSMEVSAKENTNIEEAFILLATELKVHGCVYEPLTLLHVDL